MASAHIKKWRHVTGHMRDMMQHNVTLVVVILDAISPARHDRDTKVIRETPLLIHANIEYWRGCIV